MRVLVAPDKFAGTLTAVEAAEAIAAGWARRAPDDVLDLAPMSDGGPGFVDVLHAALGGDLLAHTVRGPFGEPVPATVLVAGGTAYVESAQACGLHLTGGEGAESATTYGVGELLRAAAATGATTVVVGLGGSGTNDGGAGLLAALGATSSARLDAGARGLAGISDVDVEAALAAVGGVRLVAASDVESPLTGLFGATKTFGPQKGISEERLPVVDGWLEELGRCGGPAALPGEGRRRCRRARLRVAGPGCHPRAGDRPGDRRGGAPGSGRRSPTSSSPGRVRSTSRAVPARCRTAWPRSPRRRCARAWPWPARSWSGSREMRALGIESGYSLVDLVGKERAFADPAGSLADLAERVARTWSRETGE